MRQQRIAGSFRDPSGFVFVRDGILFRQVNQVYRADFDVLSTSGLLPALWDRGLLVRHEEVDLSLAAAPGAYKVLKPDRVPFIAYPYEWAFSAYRDAAVATLEIQIEALKYGLTLKDASAYNIQFVDGKPVFIDTLSFERYSPGTPWIAYRQYCQHFLAPVALMSRRDVRLSTLMKGFIDGVPLDVASSLLGAGSRWSLGLLVHIHAHARSQRRHAAGARKEKSGGRAPQVSKVGLQGILENLLGTVKRLKWNAVGTEWADYYTFTNYTDEAFEAKHAIVKRILSDASPRSVWDLGANNGVFSRLASRRGIPTVAFDVDPAAVEKNYLQIRNDGEENLLPLLQDLTNPSPAIGWANAERDALAERGPVDMVLVLALIHHLAISNNVPLGNIAAFLASLCRHLVIEFVPKEDSQVQKLLSSRKDIFDLYTQVGFESAFEAHFEIREKVLIPGSRRTLYWMSNQSRQRG